jgi:methionyl-tRNA formyltransferase
MRISFLCSDENHPINPYLTDWIKENDQRHNIELLRSKRELVGGELLFLISCSEVIEQKIRSNFTYTFVLHASDLPIGRGWSPHIWSLLNGADQITLSLIEAEDEVDSGQIWGQRNLKISKGMLWNEINHLLFEEELSLIDSVIRNVCEITPQSQNQFIEPTYYRQRLPSDSLISATKTIESQFNHIRVCDPVRFPAFFELFGTKYKILIEKLDE